MGIECIKEYGSPYPYPYLFMYSNFRTRARLCTQSWPNIDDSYGTWELKSMVGNMSIPMYFMQSKKLLMLRSALNFNNLTNTKYPPDLRMSKLSRVCLVKKNTTF